MLIFKNSFLKKASFLSFSQGVSILVSMFLILVIPKYVTISEYGYWQLFILYSGYVGLLHFGYSDGLYIKYGGREIGLIEKGLPSQIFIFLSGQLFFTFICCIIALTAYHNNPDKLFVFIALGIFLIIENYYRLISFLILATNKTEEYAKSVLLDKFFTILILLILLWSNNFSLGMVVTTYIVCRLLGLVYLIKNFQQFLPAMSFTHFIGDAKKIIQQCKLGIVLTVSNIVGTFIMSLGRLIVENVWSIDEFAKISLAVSLSFFLLAFITQISLVLFPILCNANQILQKKIFTEGSFILSLLLIFSFGLYFIIVSFIDYYLPTYKDSKDFFVYLFPIVLFETKTQIIYTTYCKSLNKLKLLLNVNILSFIISAVFYYIAAILHSIEFILLTMLISLAFRSITLNIILVKYYNLPVDKTLILDSVFSILFIWICRHLELLYVVSAYIICVIFLVIFFGKRIKNIYLLVK